MRPSALLIALLASSCGYDYSPPDERAISPDGGTVAGVDGGTPLPTCTNCNSFSADSCGANGQCTCGGAPACGAGQQCLSGACRCTAQSCAAGCCSGLSCLSGTDRFACGTGGAVCMPCAGLRQCVAGTCR